MPFDQQSFLFLCVLNMDLIVSCCFVVPTLVALCGLGAILIGGGMGSGRIGRPLSPLQRMGSDGGWWATMVGQPGPGHTRPPACHVGLLPVGKLLALNISRMGAFWGKIKKLESQASESVGGLGCSSSSASNRGWALWAVSCWATVHCCTLNQPPASNDSFEKSIWRKVSRVSLEENAHY